MQRVRLTMDDKSSTPKWPTLFQPIMTSYFPKCRSKVKPKKVFIRYCAIKVLFTYMNVNVWCCIFPLVIKIFMESQNCQGSASWSVTWYQAFKAACHVDGVKHPECPTTAVSGRML